MGQAEAFRYVAGATGASATARLYLGSGSTASAVAIGIYSNVGRSPGSFMGSATLSRPQSGTWNSVALSGVAIRSGTAYWLVVLQPVASTGAIRYRHQGSGATSLTSSQNNLASLPSTWSTGNSWASGTASAYVSS